MDISLGFVREFSYGSIQPCTFTRIEYYKVPKNIANAWLDYSKNWDGEILVINHPNETKVTLTDNYRLKMRSKGLHPLNLKYKLLRDRTERIDKYCDNPFLVATQNIGCIHTIPCYSTTNHN